MIKTERAHFLNTKQKKVKQEIMELLMNAVPTVLERYPEYSKWDGQVLTDIILSCLIMYNSHVIYHFIVNSNMKDNPDTFIDHLFSVKKAEILEQLKTKQ